MKTIELAIDPYVQSTETTLEQLKSAAAAQNGHAAEVIRDANGKVVKVIVKVPDGAAIDAINSNNGVSKAVVFPKGAFTDDFESYADGVDINTLTNWSNAPQDNMKVTSTSPIAGSLSAMNSSATLASNLRTGILAGTHARFQVKVRVDVVPGTTNSTFFLFIAGGQCVIRMKEDLSMDLIVVTVGTFSLGTYTLGTTVALDVEIDDGLTVVKVDSVTKFSGGGQIAGLITSLNLNNPGGFDILYDDIIVDQLK